MENKENQGNDTINRNEIEATKNQILSTHLIYIYNYKSIYIFHFLQ